MAGEIATAFVRIRPETSGFKSDTEGTVKSTLGTVTKLVAGAAAVIGAKKILGGMIDEFVESTKVAAQTNAVLKSTGGIANVTAEGVQTLAESLMNKSGVDDEAIKSGENMLLTFTSIRNEAGKGNDIFDQTSKAVLDMDTAMTHGNVTAESLAHTSILVGKALNDPVKGATALRRVGVSLTKSQQDQIKTMVAQNNVIGAQKIVLKELNTEFGGSAEAMGKTLPGSINIVKENLRNLGGEIVGRVAPAFASLTSFVIEHLPEIDAVMSAVGDGISAVVTGVIVPVVKLIAQVIGDVVAAVKPHWQSIVNDAQSVVSGFQGIASAVIDFGGKYRDVLLPLAAAIGAIAVAVKVWQVATAAWSAVTKAATAVQLAFNVVMDANPIGLVVLAIVGLVAALVVLYTRSQTARDIINGVFSGIKDVVSSVVGFVTGLWERFGGTITRVAKTEFGAVKDYIAAALSTIRDVFQLFSDLFHGRWSKLWGDVKQIVGDVFHMITAELEGTVGILLGLAEKLGLAILHGILNGIHGLISDISGIFHELGQAVVSIASEAYGWALGIGKQLVQGILDGLKALPGKVKDAAQSGLSWFHHPHLSGPPAEVASAEVGVPLARGIVEGFLLGITDLPSKISQKVHDALNTAKNIVQARQTVVTSAFSNLASMAIKAFEGATSAELDKMKGAFDAKIKRTVTDPLNAALKAAAAQNKAGLAALDAEGAQLTPAEKQLADLQSAHDEAARQAAITDAQAALATDKADPTATAEQIKSDQQALADALYAETVASLTKTAATERAALDKRVQAKRDALDKEYQDQQDGINAAYAQLQTALQAEYDQQVKNYQSERDLQETHLQTTLDNLGKSLALHPGEWQKVHDTITGMFKNSFGPDYETAGTNMGTGFAKGLRAAFPEVKKAANDLAAILAKYLPHSPAEEGPLSKAPNWTAFLTDGLRPGLVAGALAAALFVPGGGTAGGRSTLAGPDVIGALSPLGTLVDQQDRILAELERQTAAMQSGRADGPPSGAATPYTSPNAIAAGALR